MLSLHQQYDIYLMFFLQPIGCNSRNSSLSSGTGNEVDQHQNFHVMRRRNAFIHPMDLSSVSDPNDLMASLAGKQGSILRKFSGNLLIYISENKLKLFVSFSLFLLMSAFGHPHPPTFLLTYGISIWFSYLITTQCFQQQSIYHKS